MNVIALLDVIGMIGAYISVALYTHVRPTSRGNVLRIREDGMSIVGGVVTGTAVANARGVTAAGTTFPGVPVCTR
jgi:hypothetical protein